MPSRCCRWIPGLSLSMLGRGLPQVTPWPLRFQKHPTRLLIFERSFAVAHNCPQILSVQTETLVEKTEQPIYSLPFAL